MFKVANLAEELFPEEHKNCQQFMTNHKNMLIADSSLEKAGLHVTTFMQNKGKKFILGGLRKKVTVFLLEKLGKIKKTFFRHPVFT